MEVNSIAPAHYQKIQSLNDNIGKIIKGKRLEVSFVITALLAKGHILLEDNPGMGKTQMAKALAHSIAGGLGEANPADGGRHVTFKRIQFTPDLLPMDLIGSHIFDESKKDFVFRKGPLFTNVLLADEINRASPKVQSALLECMAENQISIGDHTHQLDRFFFTIATQNPIEMEGTYPLPAAQLDRFFMKISFGYVTEEDEMNILENYVSINKINETIGQVLSYQDVIGMQNESESVYVHPEIIRGVKNVIWGTRRHPEIQLGASTRAGIIFLKCLRAFALVNQRNYVVEDDIKNLAHVVLHHRLIFKNREASRIALGQVLEREMDRLVKLKIGAQ
ncbi:MAG: hypothetical protein FD123_1744 [Bacteroidetes bacterium]|nr:MAG: hypothetical protein FD123_1744 [Bacteroidota bacterium]